MKVYLIRPPSNPLSRLLAGIAAAVAVAALTFFGLFVLAVVIGVGVIGWFALTLRMWWLARQRRQGSGDAAPRSSPWGSEEGAGTANGGRTIDADYVVVSRRRN